MALITSDCAAMRLAAAMGTVAGRRRATAGVVALACIAEIRDGASRRTLRSHISATCC